MKAIKTILLMILTAAAFIFTAGCYRSPIINYYEPHVYKGSDDPLLAALQEQELQEQLRQRIRSVQTDR